MNKLGFGFLRLPMLSNCSDYDIDFEKLNQLVDYFMENGGRYFDTAYTYLNGKSEQAIRDSLVNRYPRNRYILADKLPGYLVKSHEECHEYFNEQLRRCSVNFFDVYLLHWLNNKNYEIAERNREFEFLQELKDSGKVKKTGFSYHDTADLLDTILTLHPEVDYVQLQINYLDWESEAIQSRACYEVAEKHRKSVIVMEPVKGGTLASVPLEAEELLKRVKPDASIASHAIRFAQSLPNVEIVLSGMNSMEQLQDNLQDVEPMGQQEIQILSQVAEIINRSITIPCTACGYCLKNCPKKICISNYFKLYNEYCRDKMEAWKITPVYEQLGGIFGKASDCIKCRQCEKNCPQKLIITEYLKEVKSVFEK